MNDAMIFAVVIIAFLLGVIIDQLRSINRHHKGLKIDLDRKFKLILKKLYNDSQENK